MIRNYRFVKFANLSMSSLGVFSDECSMFLDMMNKIGIDKKQQLYIIKTMINIAIRATYYIFCCRIGIGIAQTFDFDLISFLFIFLSFFLFCFFWIIQSQAAFVNCLYVAKFTIVHSETLIKFPLLLLSLLLLLLLSILLLLFFILLFNGKRSFSLDLRKPNSNMFS